MLFTTAVFACAFLPAALLLFYALGRLHAHAATAALLAASLFFYGWWMPWATVLLLASIGINFAVAQGIVHSRVAGRDAAAGRWMAAGVAIDLALLAWFKYANFLVGNVEALTGWQAGWPHVVLPLGISFFTFTQIAFLVDARRGQASEVRLLHYGLFVTYFPHLVAGPVLHHRQLMPQLDDPAIVRPDLGRFAAGLAIFCLGLAKKVVLAGGIAPYADAVFNAADAGARPDAVEAWLGAVAYALQLYFDFSGYSDMAIGISWMFNIRLPFNFDSPYRASSIVEFWRRWHMSLSHFLRDYLYLALGGNRRGRVRRHLNLMATMLLGGLWHGAAWTFVAWGGLHGLYLVANHGWRALLGPERHARLAQRRAYVAASWGLTMLAVLAAWVLFRATTFDGALRLLGAALGQVPASLPHPLLWNAGLDAAVGAGWCAVLGGIALLPANSNRIGVYLLARCGSHAAFAAAVAGAALVASLALVLVNTTRDAASAFIYFNF